MIEEEIIGPQPEEVEETLEARIKQRLEFLTKLKPYWRRFLIGFLSFLILYGGVYAFRQVQWGMIFPRPTPTPTPLPTEVPQKKDPTAGWKTYKNTGFKYSVKYPQDWEKKVESNLLALEAPGTYFPEGTDVIKGLRANIYGTSLKAINHDELLEISKLEIPDVSVAGKVEEREKTLISGIEAVLVEESTATGGLHSIFLRNSDSNEVVQVSVAYDEKGHDKHFSTFNLILSTFRFIREIKPPFVFRIDEEEEITKVIMVDAEGQERVLREYQAEAGPARKLYLSPNDKFLAVSLGTGMLGFLEIIDLATEETVETLEEYGKVIWFDEQRLVLNVPQEVEPPRPYEKGEGVSLATFDAALDEYKLLKQANKNTDYVLKEIKNQEIFFEMVVTSDPGWTSFSTSQWRTNFDGSLEEEVK